MDASIKEAAQYQILPIGAEERKTEIKKEVSRRLNPEQIERLKRVNKRVAKIRKRNKLYFRDKGDSLRRLDKLSLNLFDLIMVNFIQQDGEALYAKLNREAYHYTAWKPIEQIIDIQYEADFAKLVKAASKNQPVIYYNNVSLKPLVRLVLAK